MYLETTDVNAYSLADLLRLFNLNHGCNEEQLQLARQQLMTDLPRMQSAGMNRQHEVALFIDCACNRIRDETASSATGTWQQKTNPMVAGAGSHALQQNANTIAGRSASIVGGKYADSDTAPAGWLNPINIKTTDIAINVDSRFRNDYAATSASDWTLDLPVTMRKVTSMKIASLELPMSYYGVSMAQGNSTFVVSLCGQDFVGITGEWGSLMDGLAKKARDAKNPPADWGGLGLWDLSDPSRPINTNPGLNSASIEELFVGDCAPLPAYLVILPDGSYEIGWQDLNSAEDIVKAMASALQSAIPGAYYCQTGEFRAFYKRADWLYAIQAGLANINPDIWGALLSLYVGYDVNRCDGRSMFANSVDSVVDAEEQNKNAWPFNLHFAVDRGGNQDLTTPLQMKLGWLLGFRVGNYMSRSCGQAHGQLPVYPGTKSGSSSPGSGAHLRRTSDQLGAAAGSVSYISESVCNLEGSKYMYLCVTDGNTNYGNSLIGCFAESTFNKDIMLRVNLAAATTGAKIYRYFSLAGIASSWWRSRDYFGPVTIEKLRFRLFDEFGRLMDLNGLDWSMAIVFNRLYD